MIPEGNPDIGHNNLNSQFIIIKYNLTAINVHENHLSLYFYLCEDLQTQCTEHSPTEPLTLHLIPTSNLCSSISVRTFMDLYFPAPNLTTNLLTLN